MLKRSRAIQKKVEVSTIVDEMKSLQWLKKKEDTDDDLLRVSALVQTALA